MIKSAAARNESWPIACISKERGGELVMKKIVIIGGGIAGLSAGILA